MWRSRAWTLTFSFMRLWARSVRRALVGHYNFTHPDTQLRLLLRTCRVVGAGKGFDAQRRTCGAIRQIVRIGYVNPPVVSLSSKRSAVCSRVSVNTAISLSGTW